jgi:hypothetical protein
MAEVNQDASLIEVHGRGGLSVPYTRFRKSQQGREEQVDISASIIYIEIPAIHLRKRLLVNPSDPKGLLLKLLRAEVEKLPVTPCEFAVIDETTDTPDVEWQGRIVRTGYVGDPSV